MQNTAHLLPITPETPSPAMPQSLKGLRGPHLCKQRAKKGSALLLTLLVVSLLLVITLSFVAYVRLELRTVTERMTRVQHQNNAKLALQIALGNLQRGAGVDQAVTANADLMKPETADTAFQRKWTGVWRNDQPGFDPRNALSSFDTWLVSGMDALASPAIRDTAFANFSVQTNGSGLPENGVHQVVMLGGNSVENPDDWVVAPRVSFTTGSGTQSYAYWVSDESQKVLLPLPDPEEASMRPEQRRAQLTAPARPRFEDMTWMGPAMNTLAPATVRKFPRLIFPNETGLLSANSRTAMRRQYHDLSLYNRGLFTNPVEGGLKKDLSTAFELPEARFRRSEFALKVTTDPLEYVTNNQGASVQTKPIFNYRPVQADGSVPAGLNNDSIFRGPTFDLLRDHYRLYQSVASPFTEPVMQAKGYFPNAILNWNNDQFNHYLTAPELHSAVFESSAYNTETPTRNDAIYAPAVTDEVTQRQKFGGSGKARPRFTETEVAPEIVRILLMASIQLENLRPNSDSSAFPAATQEGDVVLILEPIVYVHNPYNVAIEFDALRTFVFNLNFGLNAFSMESDGWPFFSKLAGGGSVLHSYIQNESIALGEPFDNTSPNRDSRLAMDLVVTRSGLPVTQPVKLLPGEIKAFTANAISPTSIGKDSRVVLEENINNYSFSGGLTMSFLAGSPDANNPQPFVMRDKTLTSSGEVRDIHLGYVFDYVESSAGNKGANPLAGRGRWPVYGVMTSYLLDKSDTNPLPVRESTNSPGLRHFLITPQNYLSGMAAHKANGDIDFTLPAVPFNTLAADRHYVGFVDLYMKPSLGEHYQTEMLTHHATRAIALNPELNGAVGKNGNRIVPTWGMSVANEIQANGGEPPISRLGFGPSGKSHWGTGLTIADGQSKVILYDVPTKPLTSLAEFQHLNQQIHVWEPSYAIGNSRASAYVPREQLWNVAAHPDLVHPQFDVSYLSNEALWDRYFLSSISKPTSGNSYQSALSMDQALVTWEQSPLNPRVVPLGGHSQDARLTALDETLYDSEIQTESDAALPHNRVAEFYALAGVFNVNSVSVEAWKALLGSLNQGAIDITNDDGEVVSLTLEDTLRFFPRSPLQSGGATDSSGDRWSGQAHLSEDELNTLATHIVTQIKQRSRSRGAPFASLSQFINRELSTGPSGLAGTLQAAVEMGNFDTDLLANEGRAIKLDDEDDISDIYLRSQTDPPRIARSKEPKFNQKQTDQAYQEFPAKDHFVYNSAGGIAQHLSQADILSVIGSQLTVRADTFVIRAYGNSTGTPGEGVWCEALVQRLPDYVDKDQDPAYTHPRNLNSPANQAFGRRFEIIGFRWLTGDEI